MSNTCPSHNPTLRRTICFNTKVSPEEPSLGGYVRIYVWFGAPCSRGINSDKKEPPRSRCDFRGGHVALQVGAESASEYLGWWPTAYYVNRMNSEKIFSRRLLNITRNFTYVNGRCSDFLNCVDASPNASPNKVDGILVRNNPVPANIMALRLNTTPWHECAPDRRYDISGLHISNIMSYTRAFKSNCESGDNYQFFRNNCATVVLRALNAGGANISFRLICFPWRLDKYLWTRSS